MRPLAIYIHYPFCKAKCPYCDFNSHVRSAVDDAAFEAAYMRELEFMSRHCERSAAIQPADEWIATSASPHRNDDRIVTSIFFGGGTPSLMPARLVERIINKIDELWSIAENCEITLEANPTSVEAAKFSAFRTAGVNRVSIGVQSFDETELKFFGREHSAGEAAQAIELAAKTFDRYSFDLIYALHGQKLADWEQALNSALKLTNGHISLYQLTIEPATNFYHRKVQVAGEELAADFYDLTQDICEAHGLPAYEISNHATAGQESQHNLTYWRYGEYLGIGAGAHGRVAGHASAMVKSPEKWLEAVAEKGNGLEVWERLSAAEQEEERIMMGLRLVEGIELASGPKSELLIQHGLLEKHGDKTRASKSGRLVLNHIISKLLD